MKININSNNLLTKTGIGFKIYLKESDERKKDKMSSNTRVTPPDPNLYVADTVEAGGARFFDVRRAPFDVYGLYDYKNEPQFKRMPDWIGTSVNDGVTRLYTNTAGGRVRFCTDSPYIIVKAKMPNITHFPHMPLTGSSGFDLYVDNEETGESTYYRTFVPPYEMKEGYESKIEFKTSEMRYVTVHFPLYNNVSELYIGLADGSSVGGGLRYADTKPVVYYGSSITQGGCSSRPGNAYPNHLSRMLKVDHINLGFSGNGKAEQNICDYIATLDMSVFVMDYDHNAPNAEYLNATHYNLYETVRKAQPELPIIMISAPDIAFKHPRFDARREVIKESYSRALANGDKNVYFIDGESFFASDEAWDSCSVDGTHPNDLGFYRMAMGIAPVLAKIFEKND